MTSNQVATVVGFTDARIGTRMDVFFPWFPGQREWCERTSDRLDREYAGYVWKMTVEGESAWFTIIAQRSADGHQLLDIDDGPVIAAWSFECHQTYLFEPYVPNKV